MGYDEVIGRAADHEFATADGAEGVTLEVVKPGQQYSDASRLVAQSVVALMKDGAKLSDAAVACGTSAMLLRSNSAARAALRQLNEQWALDNDEIKQLVKTTATKLAITAEDDKARLDAVKFLGQMPDVGLTSAYSKVSVQIGVFSDETSKVLANISDD